MNDSRENIVRNPFRKLFVRTIPEETKDIPLSVLMRAKYDANKGSKITKFRRQVNKAFKRSMKKINRAAENGRNSKILEIDCNRSGGYSVKGLSEEELRQEMEKELVPMLKKEGFEVEIRDTLWCHLEMVVSW